MHRALVVSLVRRVLPYDDVVLLTVLFAAVVAKFRLSTQYQPATDSVEDVTSDHSFPEENRRQQNRYAAEPLALTDKAPGPNRLDQLIESVRHPLAARTRAQMDRVARISWHARKRAKPAQLLVPDRAGLPPPTRRATRVITGLSV